MIRSQVRNSRTLRWLVITGGDSMANILTAIAPRLAISRTIVEAHGGRIWARPNPDRGTTLRVTLPLTTGEERADDAN
jgi:K+-sensing histidine kinase KdpD